MKRETWRSDETGYMDIDPGDLTRSWFRRIKREFQKNKIYPYFVLCPREHESAMYGIAGFRLVETYGQWPNKRNEIGRIEGCPILIKEPA